MSVMVARSTRVVPGPGGRCAYECVWAPGDVCQGVWDRAEGIGG